MANTPENSWPAVEQGVLVVLVPRKTIFFRTVKVGDGQIQVEVDLLAGEYEGTGKTHRTQPVQDLRLRKARGADLAF